MSRPVQERDLRWRWERPITALSIGFWDRLACMGGGPTPIAKRVIALKEAGLLRWEDDLRVPSC